MHELAYIGRTSISHRKKLGQFFTPIHVARLMLRWVTGDKPKTILDPAFGLGVFYDVFHDEQKSNAFNTKYIGYEIDQNIISYLGNYESRNLEVHVRDYLKEQRGKYDAIICNPPYMRFQNFLRRHDVLPVIEKNLGIGLNRYSNTASIFLIKSLRELNKNGRLAYIMPFEFLNTGYGKNVKKVLLEDFLLKQIIFFENERDIFSDVTTTVCVLLCKNNRTKNAIKIGWIKNLAQLKKVADLGECVQHRLHPEDLPYQEKWSPIIAPRYRTVKVPTAAMIKIASLGKFVRGIATGANSFFSFSKERAEGLCISKNNLAPCITKSPQIKRAVFTDGDYATLLENEAAVLCLDVKEYGDINTRRYLEYGEKQGFNNRYLTKKRAPWYKLESRTPAPILVGVFNRKRLKVIRNFTNVVNFTCFHSFYPNLFGQACLNRLFIYLLSDIGQKILMNNARRYGGNLNKFEPNDLNHCLCPSVNQFDAVDEKEATKIIELAKSNEKKAIQKANALVRAILR